MSKVLVLHYSAYGHIETIDGAIAEGAREAGAQVDVRHGAIHRKIGAAFASTGTQHGGQETTLFSIITNLMNFGMIIVGMDLAEVANKL